MTKQSELDKILDELYLDAWGEGRRAEREQSGIRTVTPNFRDAKAALESLITKACNEARIDELEKLKRERIIADVIKPGEADDIFHAVTQLSIDVQIGHLKRALEEGNKDG